MTQADGTKFGKNASGTICGVAGRRSHVTLPLLPILVECGGRRMLLSILTYFSFLDQRRRDRMRWRSIVAQANAGAARGAAGCLAAPGHRPWSMAPMPSDSAQRISSMCCSAAIARDLTHGRRLRATRARTALDRDTVLMPADELGVLNAPWWNRGTRKASNGAARKLVQRRR